MAITHTLKYGEIANIDPADARGPWTMQMPANPVNADWCAVRAINEDRTLVTLDGNGKNLESVLQGVVPGLSVQTVLDGGTYFFVFNSGRDAWAVNYSHVPQRPQYNGAAYQAGSTGDLTDTNTRIPLTIAPGTTDARFDATGGILTALADLPEIEVRATVEFTLDAAANNQEVNVTMEFVVTTSGGSSIVVPAKFPFQTSRSGTFNVTLSAQLAAATLATNDTIELVASIDVGDSMDAQVVGGLVSVPASDVI